jgi:hypothetical protein
MIVTRSETWSEQIGEYGLDFTAPFGLPDFGSPRIELVIRGSAGQRMGQGHFKLRREGHEDVKSGILYDVIVISQIELKKEIRGKGVGTEIVRRLAVRFPESLFVGENQNADAERWHTNQLDRRFSTRMLRISGGSEERVTPGVSLDPHELGEGRA